MTAVEAGAVPPGYSGRLRWGAFIGGAFAEAADEETFGVT